MVKASIFKNIRTAMAMVVPPSTPNPTRYKTLFGIRPHLFSSSPPSNNHPKDLNLMDDLKEGEGVFRFDPSDGEPEMTPTRKGGTSNKQHQWNAPTDTDGGPRLTPNIKANNNTGNFKEHQWNDNNTPGTNKDVRNTTVGDMAKTAAVKAVDTGINVGDMAKQTMDNVWDAAKGTADKIKEAVAGDDEREKKGYNVPASDSGVDDLRKKAGGYDLRNSPH